MANIKKCDRCGKTYPWEYKPTHARVMVYDDKQHPHDTDLCPECDKAAAEWMNVMSAAERTRFNPGLGGVEFAFENVADADDFIMLMRAAARQFGIVTMEDAKLRYAAITRSVVKKCDSDVMYGWCETSVIGASLLKTYPGWSIRLPEPMSLDVCRKG